MKRLAEAEEVAELVFAIAAPNFPYMTGQIIGLDGGWTAYGYT
jgi:NAD(P)-dependent dehydrogenase (short-subunit alcohol dehydrogenase family)